jgi:hypothetical protein
MKKLLLLLAITLTVSCSKNCDDMKEELTQQYLKSLSYVGGSKPAIMEITRQYNEKMKQIDKDCR